MKYGTDMILFKSQLGSAMKDKIPWDSLVSLMETLCSTFDKSKVFNYFLLDELKDYKKIVQKNIVEVKVNTIAVNEEPISEKEVEDFTIKTEVFEDDDIFAEEQQIEPEAKVEIEQEYFPCQQCEKTFESDWNLKRHLWKVHEKKTAPYIGELDLDKVLEREKCPHCDEMISKTNLKRHIQKVHEASEGMRSENGDLRFPCNQCDKVLASKQILTAHIKNVHKTDDMKFKCTQCEKGFKYKLSLQKHVKMVHEGISDQFPCEHCGKIFSQISGLNVHIRGIHKRERNYACDKCDTKCFNKQVLAKHIRNVHEGIKDFVCSECGKSISSMHALKNHISAVHRNEVNFECDVCHLKINSYSALVTHKKSKHEKVTYGCDFCGKRFTLQHTLKKHMDANHGGHVFHRCEICQRKFIEKATYESHILTCQKIS